MKLTKTGKKIRCEFGRTGNNIKCTRVIWRDENGVEYIKHKEFVNGIAPLENLFPHMLDYSITE